MARSSKPKASFVIPALSTASDVLAYVETGETTKAEAVAFLQARVDACVAAGRRPKFPTLKALGTLTGDAPAIPKGLATRRSKLNALHEERVAARTAKAAATKAAKAPAKPKASGESLNDIAKRLKAMSDADLAKFFLLLK